MTELPASWHLETLGAIAGGGLFVDGDWVESKDQDPTGKVRLTQLADVGVGEFRDRSNRWLRDDQAARLGCTFLEPGDVLVARMPEPLGRACIVPADIGHAVTVVDVAIVRPARADILPKYLVWALNSPNARKQVADLQSGTTRRRISRKNLSSVSLPVPPLDEQRRIVDILEDHLSRLDAANAGLKLVTSRLESLRIARWRACFGQLSELWPNRPLDEVVHIENGQTPKGLAALLVDGPGPESVPYYKVGDMNAGDSRSMSDARFFIARSVAASLGLHVRPGGCVLIPKRGGAISTNKKRLLMGEAAYDLNTMGLRPNAELRQRYLWHWLDGIDLGVIADGSNVPQINAPQIRRLTIPVPPIEVQDATCDELDTFMTQREATSRQVARSTKRTATLSRALLAAAFAGRLTGRSSDLDRAEEMVSV